MNGSKMSKGRLIATILIMGACWSICYLIPFIQYVFYDPFQEMLGCTNAQLGLLMTVYGLGNLYGCPIGGWIADRFNYKIVYSASVLVNGILGIIFVLNPTYSAALVMWVGFSVASLVMNYPAHIKIVRNLVGDEDQGKIFGFNETAVGIANIVFNAFMMLLFTKFLEGTAGLKAAILGLSVISILLCFAAWFIIENPNRVKKEGEPAVEKYKMGSQGLQDNSQKPCNMAHSAIDILNILVPDNDVILHSILYRRARGNSDIHRSRGNSKDLYNDTLRSSPWRDPHRQGRFSF